MVRDLMLKCVERRFGMSHAPHRVAWLTDDGSCFAAKDTVEFASWLGLVSRFTPETSPGSNGMAEAFVKTFKRDHVYVNDRPDAQTVLSQHAAWFEDYNESLPHKALRMQSPREFIRSLATTGCPVSRGNFTQLAFEQQTVRIYLLGLWFIARTSPLSMHSRVRA